METAGGRLSDFGCGTCGKPATNASRDAHELEPVNGIDRWASGEIRFGCDEHPTRPVEIPREVRL